MNKKLILILIILLLNIKAFAALSRDESLMIFSEANKAFSQANKAAGLVDSQKLYEQAILGYEKIIDQGGIKNAKLYYNLGNAYLLNDNIAKAILNYRRAQSIDSSTPDIFKNLNYARSRRIDNIPVSVEKKVLERLFFWHYDFSMKTRFIIGGFFFALFCIWLILRLWIAKWPRVIAVYVISLIIAFSMLSSIFIEYYNQTANRSGVIIIEKVVARQGDGNNYPQSFDEPLHAGLEFELLEQRGGWLHIKITNSHDTWIPDQSAELI
jgi:tetratricopeptide (TPR) repeat protein